MAGRCAAFLVLTHYDLLQLITSFQDGLPYPIGAFDASLVTPDGSKLGAYRGKLPQFAIRRRNLPLLKLMLKATQDPQLRTLPQLQFRSVCRCAIEYNSLEILQWLHATRDSSPTTTNEGGLLRVAVTSYFDNVGIMEWLHSTPEGPREAVSLVRVEDICRAAGIGNIQALRWLHEHGSSAFSPVVMDTAAAHGHLEMVQFLHENRTEGCTTGAMHSAALNGYHEVVEYLAQNRSEGPNLRTLELTASAGHLRCVEVLCKLAKPPPRGKWRLALAHQRALEEGHTDVARFLAHQQGLRSGAEKTNAKKFFCFWILK